MKYKETEMEKDFLAALKQLENMSEKEVVQLLRDYRAKYLRNDEYIPIVTDQEMAVYTSIEVDYHKKTKCPKCSATVIDALNCRAACVLLDETPSPDGSMLVHSWQSPKELMTYAQPPEQRKAGLDYYNVHKCS